MRKILVGFIMDGKSGGLDQYLLHLAESLSEPGIQMDFLTNEIDTELEEYLRQYRIRLFAIPNLRHPAGQYQCVRRLIQKEHYDTAYFNVSTAIDCIAAMAAKREGVKRIVLQCHASGNDCENWVKRYLYNSVHYVCRSFFHKAGTHFAGCSRNAGYWAFPRKVVDSEKFSVILSAVDKERFRFRAKAREQMRKELGLEDQFVLGHAGNFCYVKNYFFMLEVFRELLKIQPNATLVLVGNGGLFERVQERAKEMHLEKKVLFLGWRSDTHLIEQAMDMFLLPSIFEGLSMAALEAQCANLACVVSDTVPSEVKITERCYFLPLKESPRKWAEFIVQHKEYQREISTFLNCEKAYNLEEQKEEVKQLLEL